jgi:dTDP-4-dehydrorhamnose reductase
MTKILLFGRSGQVGWELRHKLACLAPLTVVGSDQVDFANPDSIRAIVRDIGPAIIVNAAAYTAVDKAESEPGAAMAINGLAPGVLAEEARRLRSLLVHYSTDYVFDGTREGAYVETDATNPLNVYGQSKLAGDEAIQAVGGDYLILRTSWVYGSRGANFLLTMLRLARERSELRIVDDQAGAPTSSECIAQATSQMLAQVLTPKGGGLQGRSGVYNLTCTGSSTWYGFACVLLNRISASSGVPMPKMVPIPTSEFPRPAKRPANSRLSGQKVEEIFGVNMPAWEDALGLVIESLGEGQTGR